MKIIFLLNFRHIRKQFLHTLLTFMITMLMITMLSALFNFAASFLDAMRTAAIDSVGSYHYKFTSPHSGQLQAAAENLKKDPWAEQIVFEENMDGEGVLYITAAKPGIFTSRQMREKLKDQVYALYGLGQEHNWALLASYGDLSRENGFYVFLFIFILLFSLIFIVSVLTLRTVFQISANQRERDFGLLGSIGADSRQISMLVLAESLLYLLLAVPAGVLLGLYLLNISRNLLDRILAGLDTFSPVRLVISVPFEAALILCACIIILSSSAAPARRAGKIRSIEAMRQNHAIHTTKYEAAGKESFTEKILKKHFYIEGELAYKTSKRFQKRYRLLSTVMLICIILCFTTAGISRYTNKAIAFMYRDRTYTLEITLSGDEEALLRQSADAVNKTVKQISGQEFQLVQEVIFMLRPPYPLSTLGETTEILASLKSVPDIQLVAIEEEEFMTICTSLGIDRKAMDSIQKEESGSVYPCIFIDTDYVWQGTDAMEKGNPYDLDIGNRLPIYADHFSSPSSEQNSSDQKAAAHLQVSGSLKNWPIHIPLTMATRMAVLVSEQTFSALKFKSPYYPVEPAAHHLSLRGLFSDTDSIEQAAMAQIDKEPAVYGKVHNYDREMRQEEGSILGIRYLLYGFIAMLFLFCLSGNFIVDYMVEQYRVKEYAILRSVGMTEQSMLKMKLIELSLRSIKALLPGIIIGLFLDYRIYKVYTSIYHIPWKFPVKGLLNSLLLLGVTALLSGGVSKAKVFNKTIAERMRAGD